MEIKLFSLYNLLVTQRMIFLGKVFLNLQPTSPQYLKILQMPAKDVQNKCNTSQQHSSSKGVNLCGGRLPSPHHNVLERFLCKYEQKEENYVLWQSVNHTNIADRYILVERSTLNGIKG